jgi:hypothetical protein
MPRPPISTGTWEAMDALDRMGLTGNTILVFTSDHGEMFGAHGRCAKYIFYEEAARVPFLIRWPGKIPPKLVSHGLLGTPDIMPTLLSLLNLPIPDSVEGLDLSSHARGSGGSAPDAAHMQGMGTTAAWTDGTEWRDLRDHEYTYAIYRRDGHELLFHHHSDPYQVHDLDGERPAARCGIIERTPEPGARSTTTRSNLALDIATIGPVIAISFRRPAASSKTSPRWKRFAPSGSLHDRWHRSVAGGTTLPRFAYDTQVPRRY